MMFTEEQAKRADSLYGEMITDLRTLGESMSDTLRDLKEINRILGITPTTTDPNREAASYVSKGDNDD